MLPISPDELRRWRIDSAHRISRRLQESCPKDMVVTSVVWPTDDRLIDATVLCTRKNRVISYGRCLDSWDHPEWASASDYDERERVIKYAEFVNDAERWVTKRLADVADQS